MKIKLITFVFVILLSLTACKKQYCISCIAQNKRTGMIIENSLQCSDRGFVNGYGDGFKERYKTQSDSVMVICSY
jgi:hypothetical protein